MKGFTICTVTALANHKVVTDPIIAYDSLYYPQARAARQWGPRVGTPLEFGRGPFGPGLELDLWNRNPVDIDIDIGLARPFEYGIAPRYLPQATAFPQQAFRPYQAAAAIELYNQPIYQQQLPIYQQQPFYQQPLINRAPWSQPQLGVNLVSTPFYGFEAETPATENNTADVAATENVAITGAAAVEESTAVVESGKTESAAPSRRLQENEAAKPQTYPYGGFPYGGYPYGGPWTGYPRGGVYGGGIYGYPGYSGVF